MPHVKFMEMQVFNGRKDNRKAIHKCAVMGCWKKRTLSCNQADRGSKFALMRKQAYVLCRCFIEEKLTELFLYRNSYRTHL